MCHDPQIFLKVQVVSLSLQACQNYNAAMVWPGQSNYIHLHTLSGEVWDTSLHVTPYAFETACCQSASGSVMIAD